MVLGFELGRGEGSLDGGGGRGESYGGLVRDGGSLCLLAGGDGGKGCPVIDQRFDSEFVGKYVPRDATVLICGPESFNNE